MHEFVLTQTLIEEVQFAMQSHTSEKISVVNIGFGPFTHATFDRIEFWWNTLIQNSPLDGVKLVKHSLEGKLYCPQCDQEFIIRDVKDHQYDEYLEIFSCPKCASYQTKITEGTEILILNLELVTIPEI